MVEVKKIEQDEEVSPWLLEAYQLDLAGMAKEVAVNSILLEQQQGSIRLQVNSSMQPMMNDKVINDVQDALSHFYDHVVDLSLEYVPQFSDETPALYKLRMAEQARLEFIDELSNSEFGLAITNGFNAVLLEHSVKKT